MALVGLIYWSGYGDMGSGCSSDGGVHPGYSREWVRKNDHAVLLRVIVRGRMNWSYMSML